MSAERVSTPKGMQWRNIGLFVGTSLVLALATAVLAEMSLVIFAGILAMLMLLWAVLEKPYGVLVFITLLIPYEDFFLKWLPVSESIFLLLRLASELILYALLIRVLVGRLLKGRRLIRTPIDWFLVVFLLSGLFSIFLNNASWIGGVVNIRALLRYFAVYYIVVNMGLTKKQTIGLFGAIAAAGLVQALIALAQFFGGNAVASFFSPPVDVSIELGQVAVERLRYTVKLGAVGGTTGKPAAMGLFLTVALIATLALRTFGSVSKWFVLAAIGLLSVGVAITYKRGELMLLVLALSFYLVFRLKKRTRYYFVILLGIVLVAIVILLFANLQGAGELVNPHAEQLTVGEHFQQLLTISYWQRNLQSSRGWFIFRVGGVALRTGGLFGYSPDSTHARAALATLDPEFLRLIEFRVFEDVYWVAMLIYYGLLGLALFAAIQIVLLVKAFQMQNWNGFPSVIAKAYVALGLITIPAGFLERIFELRTYSYYLWLSAGLLMSFYLRYRPAVKSGEPFPGVAMDQAIATTKNQLT